MKISIITVCKNSEKYIEKCIRSVIAQTYEDIEYIIVDGNSQDKTKEIIARYTSRISQLISEPDRGIYQAMNKGIKLASGSFIYFLNSDDYLVDENVIRDVAIFININSGCDIFYGNLEVRVESAAPYIVIPPQPEAILDYMIAHSMPHQATFARTDVFEKVGFFNESYKIASDSEWYLNLLQDTSIKFCYYPRVIGSYYISGLSSNVRAGLTEFWEIQNRAKIYQSEYWLKRRIVQFEEKITSMEEQLANWRNSFEIQQKEAEIQRVSAQLQQVQNTITVMETSKFWQMKKAWLRLKNVLGCAGKDGR